MRYLSGAKPDDFKGFNEFSTEIKEKFGMKSRGETNQNYLFSSLMSVLIAQLLYVHLYIYNKEIFIREKLFSKELFSLDLHRTY